MHSGTKFGHNKLEGLRYHMVKTWNLSHLGLTRYRVVTDEQTDGQVDRITTASTRLALRAVARKNEHT